MIQGEYWLVIRWIMNKLENKLIVNKKKIVRFDQIGSRRVFNAHAHHFHIYHNFTRFQYFNSKFSKWQTKCYLIQECLKFNCSGVQISLRDSGTHGRTDIHSLC